MILLIDNYDSFVYNLARYLAEMGCEPRVVRNDSVSVEDVRQMAPQAILLSPGPCTPQQAGISVDLVRQLAATTPMLGVCLGHQAICAALGGQIVRAAQPIHGRTSDVIHSGHGLFEGVSCPLRATRYHSLIVAEKTLPDELPVTARTPDGVPMAVEHVRWPLYGVQFHPESVLTESGHRLLANFLRLAGVGVSNQPAGDRVGDGHPAQDQRDGPVTIPAGMPIHW